MAEQKKPEPKQPEPARHVYDEPEKVVPEKGSAGYDTPSGYALAKAGGDGEKYAAEKARKRWGY